MKKAPYRVHRLIQDLNANPAAAKRFKEEPESVFDDYGITEGERKLLRDGSSAMLIELGVHPNLQMKFIKLRSPPPSGGGGPLAYYFKKMGLGE